MAVNNLFLNIFVDSLDERLVKCTKLGSLMRKGRDRVVTLRLSSDGRHLACHVSIWISALVYRANCFAKAFWMVY